MKKRAFLILALLCSMPLACTASDWLSRAGRMVRVSCYGSLSVFCGITAASTGVAAYSLLNASADVYASTRATHFLNPREGAVSVAGVCVATSLLGYALTFGTGMCASAWCAAHYGSEAVKSLFD